MRDPRAETLAAYQAGAAAYAAGVPALPDSIRRLLDTFATRVGAGGRVLEIGSGPGRDAAELEARGLQVRRTDITPAFVDLLRAAGHEADVLDPLVDNLVDPTGPYDAVWCDAVLLHVARAEVPTVLARLRAVTRPGGTLAVTLKEGDGEAWSTHGHVAGARHFTYWREGPLREVVARAGWRVLAVERRQGPRDPWLQLLASAAE